MNKTYYYYSESYVAENSDTKFKSLVSEEAKKGQWVIFEDLDFIPADLEKCVKIKGEASLLAREICAANLESLQSINAYFIPDSVTLNFRDSNIKELEKNVVLSSIVIGLFEGYVFAYSTSEEDINRFRISVDEKLFIKSKNFRDIPVLF